MSPVGCAQTRIVRSWDLSKPLLFAAAMNTLMWSHPITSQHIDTLLSFGFHQIECIEKTLACGDTGVHILSRFFANFDHFSDENFNLIVNIRSTVINSWWF